MRNKSCHTVARRANASADEYQVNNGDYAAPQTSNSMLEHSMGVNCGTDMSTDNGVQAHKPAKFAQSQMRVVSGTNSKQ